MREEGSVAKMLAILETRDLQIYNARPQIKVPLSPFRDGEVNLVKQKP